MSHKLSMGGVQKQVFLPASRGPTYNQVSGNLATDYENAFHGGINIMEFRDMTSCSLVSR
jgi:hypothetical protein